jgi:hypothetical protein
MVPPPAPPRSDSSLNGSAAPPSPPEPLHLPPCFEMRTRLRPLLHLLLRHLLIVDSATIATAAAAAAPEVQVRRPAR